MVMRRRGWIKMKYKMLFAVFGLIILLHVFRDKVLSRTSKETSTSVIEFPAVGITGASNISTESISRSRISQMLAYCDNNPSVESFQNFLHSDYQNTTSKVLVSDKYKLMYCDVGDNMSIQMNGIFESKTRSLWSYPSHSLSYRLKYYPKIMAIQTFKNRLVDVDKELNFSSKEDFPTPYYDLCHPCIVRYNYILVDPKIEESLNSLLRENGLSDVKLNNLGSSKITTNWNNTQFLQELYQKDIGMFGEDVLGINE